MLSESTEEMIKSLSCILIDSSMMFFEQNMRQNGGIHMSELIPVVLSSNINCIYNVLIRICVGHDDARIMVDELMNKLMNFITSIEEISMHGRERIPFEPSNKEGFN